MAFVLIGIIMLVALLIPIFGILVDSPIGRALARRLEGPEQIVPGNVVDLAEGQAGPSGRPARAVER
jgi:hypothetical protein